MDKEKMGLLTDDDVKIALTAVYEDHVVEAADGEWQSAGLAAGLLGVGMA